MPVEAYQGHEPHSSFRAAALPAADNPLAPADRTSYSPAAFANQPGAAARTNNYPRTDGQAFGGGSSFGK